MSHHTRRGRASGDGSSYSRYAPLRRWPRRRYSRHVRGCARASLTSARVGAGLADGAGVGSAARASRHQTKKAPPSASRASYGLPPHGLEM